MKKIGNLQIRHKLGDKPSYYYITDKNKNVIGEFGTYGEAERFCEIQKRLKYLRGEIEKERISYGEIAELQNYKKEIIKSGDVLLAEWAGIPEKEFNNLK